MCNRTNFCGILTDPKPWLILTKIPVFWLADDQVLELGILHPYRLLWLYTSLEAHRLFKHWIQETEK